MTLLCLSAETGEEQWRKICADWSYTTNLNVYAIRGLIWVHADAKEGQYDLLGLDPATGEVKVKYDLSSILTTRHHHRCYRNRATEKFLLVGKEGVEYVNLENGDIHPHRWLRGMCLYGVMPANGLLYVPPQACSCNPMTMLEGYWALAAGRSTKVEGRRTKGGDRLERGPAYIETDLRPSPFDLRPSTFDLRPSTFVLPKTGPCTATTRCAAGPPIPQCLRGFASDGRPRSAIGSRDRSLLAAAYSWHGVTPTK